MTNSPSSSPSPSSFAKSSGEGSNPSDELFARQLAEAQADPEWRAKWAPGPRTTITLPWPPASLSGHAKGHWRGYTVEEVCRLRREYRAAVEEGRLEALAGAMGRTRLAICSKASALGLTDPQRGRELAAAAAQAKCAGVPKWTDRPHPRGFAGHRHTEQAKRRCTDGSVAWWKSLSPTEKDERVTENLRAALAKNGRVGPITPNRASTWKAGWREIAGRRHYFRSRWEANYARYLQWLKDRGEILEWEYEPETYWFENIRRGTRSYLPDFRVHELNGSKPLHEVKGWMDARSRTTLKRMAKYFPDVTVLVIREKEYRAIAKFSGLIGGWE